MKEAQESITLALGEKKDPSGEELFDCIGRGYFTSINNKLWQKEMPAVVGSNDAAWDQNRRSVTVFNS